MSDLRIKADNLGRLYRDFVSRARLLLLLTEKNSATCFREHAGAPDKIIKTTKNQKRNLCINSAADAAAEFSIFSREKKIVTSQELR